MSIGIGTTGIGVVTLLSGDRTVALLFEDQATAPVTAFQCAVAWTRLMNSESGAFADVLALSEGGRTTRAAIGGQARAPVTISNARWRGHDECRWRELNGCDATKRFRIAEKTAMKRLQSAGWSESLHLVFPFSQWQMRILCAIVQALVGPLLDRWHDVTFGRESCSAPSAWHREVMPFRYRPLHSLKFRSLPFTNLRRI